MNVGIDEAGRGCVFGPVVSAAVVWDDSIEHKWLKDSKKLTPKQRALMYDWVKDNAIDYAICSATVEEIDSLNILNATMVSMHRCLDELKLDFDHIYVDGTYFKKYKEYDHTCVVKGDESMKSISAASILAKVFRDMTVSEMGGLYPEYNIEGNKGYCTKQHCDAIQQYGRTELHRKSFRLPFEKQLW